MEAQEMGPDWPLVEELQREGSWLFRWRSYVPLLLLPVLLAATGISGEDGGLEPGPWWILFSFLISLAGLGIRVLTVGCVPRGTSGRTTREPSAAALNTTGMYSVVRHPLYLGNFVIWTGVSLAVARWWATAIVLLAFALIYERIMLAEEQFLRREFGEAFERWSRVTPAVMPRWANWRPPSLPFSLRAALKREYSGVFGTITMFTFIELVHGGAAVGDFHLDLHWAALFGAGLLAYVTLLALKKKTKVLHIEGR
jgi:protein-S-isoprenylcysteine O-methyltransferase Ste14